MTSPNSGDTALTRGLRVARLHGYHYDLRRVGGPCEEAARVVTSAPYDVISTEEHRALLEGSPYNISWLTLGSSPGAPSSYEERRERLSTWIEEGILVSTSEPSFYVYVIDYAVPGGVGAKVPSRARFLGVVALGELVPLDAGIVLPHEKTFPKVVEDRFRLLEATRANLENILLLYSDPDRSLDLVLESQVHGSPVVRVEAKPGEWHELYACRDEGAFRELQDFFGRQRPIIADGHHRYTTSLRYAQKAEEGSQRAPGAQWQMMTFANLYGEGLSILATHRLVRLRGMDASGGAGATRDAAVARILAPMLSRLEESSPERAHFRIETRGGFHDVRIPQSVLQQRRGVGRTSYAILHDVVFGDWLAADLDPDAGIRYFKEGTGEVEALRRGDGDVLFRMKPVQRAEFESVVHGGEVFPHKTTYFYPKLWSGLVIWPLEDPEAETTPPR